VSHPSCQIVTRQSSLARGRGMIVVVERVAPAAKNSTGAISISSIAMKSNPTMQLFADVQQTCNTRSTE
jgi:hypothetical protein